MRKAGCLAVAAFLTDRVVKILSAGIPEQGTVLIPGILGLRQARNTGMAFSLFAGHPVLLGLMSAGIIFGAFLILRGKELRSLTLCGLMLMLGGAAGNLIDRLLSGYVPDMIEFLWTDFAVFNIADACLVIGCGLVILDLIKGEKHG